MAILSHPMYHRHRAAAEIETRATVYCGACGEKFIVIMPGAYGVGEVPCVNPACNCLITFPYGVAGAE